MAHGNSGLKQKLRRIDYRRRVENPIHVLGNRAQLGFVLLCSPSVDTPLERSCN